MSDLKPVYPQWQVKAQTRRPPTGDALAFSISTIESREKERLEQPPFSSTAQGIQFGGGMGKSRGSPTPTRRLEILQI